MVWYLCLMYMKIYIKILLTVISKSSNVNPFTGEYSGARVDAAISNVGALAPPVPSIFPVFTCNCFVPGIIFIPCLYEYVYYMFCYLTYKYITYKIVFEFK